MTGPRSAAHRIRDERGAVLVFVALTLPVMIGVGGLVMDVGNWFAHKRHLQVQADAAALAGAGKFRVPCDATVSAAIKNEAAKYSSVEYSGVGYSPGPGYNPQVGATPPERLHRLINQVQADNTVVASKRFYGNQGPVDDTVAIGDPCAAKMVDVKLTETDLPWFLAAAKVVPFVNAHARVEIRKKSSSGARALPVGVPEIGPLKAKALFVDETTGDVIASTNLVRTGTSASGLAIWSNAATPKTVTIDRANIGVRIVMSGTTSTTCGDSLVSCYGAGTNSAIVAGDPGLSHIRGWSSTPAGTVTAPQVRDAQVFGAGCEDGYFTATATYPCTVNVGAVVDFGGTIPATARVLAKRTAANDNTAVELAVPAAAAGQWIGGPVSITNASSTSSIELLWQTGCDPDRTKKCNERLTSLGSVQRIFVANESVTVSGPIKLLRISETGVPGANSFKRCGTCTHDLVVTLGLKPSLQTAQSIGDPIVSLKVAGGGSQNQGLDCDPSKPNIREELATGCGPKYAINEGSPCPGGSSALWATAQPWKCVAINTGATVGQVTQGMNQRILGSTNPGSCTAPNNWSSFPNLPEGDPRVVDVFLTPFGSFGGSGSGTVPVVNFSSFYVTGWDGGACQGNGDDPAGQGSIVGHYIKYIYTLNDGGGGEELCDYDSLGSCVAVITR